MANSATASHEAADLIERLQAMTPFINCCDTPHLKQFEVRTGNPTADPTILHLDLPPLGWCDSCNQIVMVCPCCDHCFSSITGLAEWQNHYSQFSHYDSDTTLRRAQQLLKDSFPHRTLEAGHYFYTLWQGVCDRHPHSYIWLQERPAKYS